MDHGSEQKPAVVNLALPKQCSTVIQSPVKLKSVYSKDPRAKRATLGSGRHSAMIMGIILMSGPGSEQGYEAFANMTEGLVNRGDKLYEDLLKAFVPNFLRWYDDLLKEIFKRGKAIKP